MGFETSALAGNFEQPLDPELKRSKLYLVETPHLISADAPVNPLVTDSLPGQTETMQPVIEFDEHGSLPDSIMMDHYGLTSEEGRAIITMDEWSGTWAQMLSDPDCPVGARLRKIHAEDGIEGVKKFVEGTKMMGAETSIVVSTKAPEDYARAGVLTPVDKKKVILTSTQTQDLL